MLLRIVPLKYSDCLQRETHHRVYIGFLADLVSKHVTKENISGRTIISEIAKLGHGNRKISRILDI